MKVTVSFNFEFEPDTKGLDPKEKKSYAEHVTRLELNDMLRKTSDPSSLFTIKVEDDGDDHPIPID